jgi:acyl dehydratase
MALDRALVGRSYPPSAVYEVGRAKIAEFATAIGADDLVHHDAEAARAAAWSPSRDFPRNVRAPQGRVVANGHPG